MIKRDVKCSRLREKDDVIKEMAEDYINFVQEFTNSKRNFSRKFYIIIKGDDNMEDKIAKIKEGLGSCGNFVQECNTEKLIIIMKNCFNKRLRGLERVMI